MYGTILFYIIISIFQIGFCSFAGLFEEWSKIKEEPSPGYGMYEFVPLTIGMCEPGYKRDPNIWVNSSEKIYKKYEYYNVDVDLVYPENVSIHKIHTEGWGKVNKKIVKIAERTVKNPCKYSVLNVMFKVIKIYPNCTILKGHYKFTYENPTKIISSIMKYSTYMRLIWKMEFFNVNGQFACSFVIADIQQRHNN